MNEISGSSDFLAKEDRFYVFQQWIESRLVHRCEGRLKNIHILLKIVVGSTTFSLCFSSLPLP